MKSWDNFQSLRKQKIKFSLSMRMTLLVGAVVLISILIAFGISRLMEALFPSSVGIPLLVQLNVFSFFVATVAAYFLSKLFFNPIKELRSGMQDVADGKLNTHLETSSSSKEIQELFAGFNMMTDELASTEILQTDFVSNVSHEFKTPINAIEGYATLLQGADGLDETETEYVEKILLNTKRLSTLVSNILLLSKIENQSIQSHRERYALDEQIRESIVALEPAWESKDINFDVDLADVTHYGNEPMMRHVWDNVIGNAVKFSPLGGTIRIRLYYAEDRVVCTISDEGPGLSEQSLVHLFDKFYQEDTSHKEKGNGLGLALVKRILAVEGGTVTVRNLPEKGCSFTVTLP